MSPLGSLHTACALAALAAGAWVLVRPKGTRAHRHAGYAYAASMLALNATALLIYRLSGRFGLFHGLALVSLATLAAGLYPAIRRRPAGRWVERHYYGMAYSYVGLLAATAAEAAVRLPQAPFWCAVLLASVAVTSAGAVVIALRARRVLTPFAAPPAPAA